MDCFSASHAVVALCAAYRALFKGGPSLVGSSVGHSAGLLSCLLAIGLLLRSFLPQSLLFVSQIVYLRHSLYPTMSFSHPADDDAKRVASRTNDTPTLASTLSSSVTGAAPPLELKIPTMGAAPEDVHRSSTTVGYLNSLSRHAANVAVAAAEIATGVGKAHAVLVDNHRRLFLQKAFGLNVDGSSLGDNFLPNKQYRSVKSVEQ